MGRGGKPAKSNAEAKLPVARKAPKDEGARVRDLEKRLAEALKREAETLGKLQTRTRELAESQEQQKATSEILRIISRSPTNLQPVLDAIATNAALVCDAYDAVVFLRAGDGVRYAAHYGPINITLQHASLSRGSVTEAAILDRQPVHVPDLLATEPPAFPLTAKAAREGGFRTVLSVPLLRENEAIGALAIRRREVQPFTDQQIELLKTFADQAVIAIENVRLFNETKEALEQQTATSEILRVIGSSPTDAQPVFETIARSGIRVCGALGCVVFVVDGGMLHVAATHGIGPERVARFNAEFPKPLASADIAAARTIRERSVFHLADFEHNPNATALDIENARLGGYRTRLMVPMVRGSSAVGLIAVTRESPTPFPDQQVELLKTFADQAVIAIENVRLFKELESKNRDLTTALAQQTATSEILRVISSSPTEVRPVFDAIIASAVKLCNAHSGILVRVESGLIHRVTGIGPHREAQESVQRTFPRPIDPTTTLGQAILERRVVQLPDTESPTGPPTVRDAARLIGFRAELSVPMLRDGEPIGGIAVTRRNPGPFSSDEVQLLQTFADQAVIAIENVRLFNETKEALERQTATSEILRVISQSPTDVQPVFDAIVRNAVRLCEGLFGTVLRLDGDRLHLAAHHNLSPAGLQAYREHYPVVVNLRETVASGAILDRRVVQVIDSTDPAVPPRSVAMARATGFLGIVVVPMLRDGEPIGVINVARQERGPFSDRQVALLQTFADQAVIAIENVRLFKETKEALEQQTATSEILRVISQSPTDVGPVFDAILASSTRLCEADYGILFLAEADGFRAVAFRNVQTEFAAVLAAFRQFGAKTGMGRLARDKRPVHIPDVLDDDAYREGEPTRLATINIGGVRTWLGVPLLNADVLIGAIVIYRKEQRAFTNAQIALLQTFSDQAVIAIENVRLFTELQTSNRELTAALDKQTATSDILRVISQSQTDVKPVFDAILGSAVRLLRGFSGLVTRIAGDRIELAALTSTDDVGDAATRAVFPQSHQSDGPHAQAMRDRAPINITDAQTDPRVPEAVRANARARGNRSWVIVPLLRHDEAVGTIAVTRREPGGFTDDEIALLKTFADQAVIAIENARLLTELQARTRELSRSVEQLTALGEVGQTVSSSLDLETVLTTIVSRAVDLSGLDGGVVSEYDEVAEEFVQRAVAETGGVLAQALRGVRYRKGEGALGRTAITREPVQVPDITVPGAYDSRVRENLIESGIRAVLAVPMIHQDRLIGCLGVTRKRPGEFPAETIDLLRTFATQSALAIQNARLFREIADKSRQLEVASQHKSEFLANMSHELRTPLNAIIGFSEVLMDRMFGELNEKQDEYLKDIYASGTHLLSLINDILDLSKIEAGRMELELSDFHLPTALDNALTLVRERAGRRSITVQMTVDERLGEVRADERKIRQVVLNLLSNAIKFTLEGGRIDVGAVPKDGFVEVSVSDTGVGIAPEDQDAVFEEFRQVGTAEKKAEGTGLGLTLCRKFIELHGGRIWVKSQVGVGSTFTFTIPVPRRGE